MKREILFRGKSPKGHWIYGMPSCDLKYIFNDSNYDSHDQFEIIPETVGQFTGLADKNGVKVFEGDIVRVKWFDGEKYQYTNYEIYYEENQMGYYLRGNEFNWEYLYRVEIIGNIHDNPELIKITKQQKFNKTMKQINNQKSEVFLSTYDNSDLLLPVSEEYKVVEKVCVAVKFGDTVIKISPANTCKCSWNEAMEKHKDKLTHPAYWQMVGSVYYEVNQAIEMLGHDPLRWVWTDTEDNDPLLSGLGAWYYRGPYGSMNARNKSHSNSLRATKVFKIEEY